MCPAVVEWIKKDAAVCVSVHLMFSFLLLALQPECYVETQEESVLLPFKTTADLHHVVSVYWTVSEPTEKIVYCLDVYKNNQQGVQDESYRGRTEMNEDPLITGDLSLTLNKPLPTDSHSYTCTVCNKDGRTLVQKVVTLRVRGECNSAVNVEEMM